MLRETEVRGLKAKATGRSYRTSSGTPMLVFSVAGTPDALAAYKEAQGQFYRESDGTDGLPQGTPLYFSGVATSTNLPLMISRNNRVVVEDDINQIINDNQKIN